MYKKALEYLNKFYEQDFKSQDKIPKIFELLNEVIPFETCAMFYLVPDELQLKSHKNGEFKAKYKIDKNLTGTLYHTNTDISEQLKQVLKTGDYITASRLKVNGTVLGVLCLSRKDFPFNSDETNIFNTYTKVISNIIKDIELSKILTRQTKTLQKGLEDTRSAYETIKEQNKKIKENEKLQNHFLANISHDLRTPLNSIIGFSEILSNELFGELNPKQREYIEDIRIAGIRLLGMINEVLDITKLESHTIKINITNIDITVLINEVCNILKPLYNKKNIQITFNCPQKTEISGDYIKLQQVLFNILGNAIKFSPPNSTIHISAEKNNNYLEISIKDNGIGISKTNQKKIFKKFYQAENPLSKTEISTGLGLTIAKEFVKLHKGEITVQSELKKGSVFTIKLPIMND